MSPNRWYNGNNKNHMETAEMERIMKTTIIGFPRVGSLRELKFASEKYFRNEITAQELEQTAQQLRAAHWNLQKFAKESGRWPRGRNRTDSGKRFLFL